MADTSDDELIRMYREGDADAFDVLFDRHHCSVYNFGCAMLEDRHDAEEVLQETFLRVARRIPLNTRSKAWRKSMCVLRLA